MLLRLLLLLAVGASALHAARPWPVFKRSYISALAGPAVEFETSATRRWYGTPGQTVPGTSWTVQAIRFMPQGVFLIDRQKAVACALAENRSPWYEPHARVVDMPPLAPATAARPEAPPAPRTAAWYAELARQYAFVGRTAESGMFSERARVLRRAGDTSEPRAPALIENPANSAELKEAARRDDAVAQAVLERLRVRDEARRQKKDAEDSPRNGATDASPGDPATAGVVTAGLAGQGAPRTALTADRAATSTGSATQATAGASATDGASSGDGALASSTARTSGNPAGASAGPLGAAAGAAAASVTAGTPSPSGARVADTSSSGPAPAGATGPVSAVTVASNSGPSGPSGGSGPVASEPVASTASGGPVGPSVSAGPVAVAAASSGPGGGSFSSGPVAVAAASSGPGGGSFGAPIGASFGGGGGGMRGPT